MTMYDKQWYTFINCLNNRGFTDKQLKKSLIMLYKMDIKHTIIRTLRRRLAIFYNSNNLGGLLETVILMHNALLKIK